MEKRNWREDWRETVLGERELRKFFAYTGLTAPPHSLQPPTRKMRGCELQKWLMKQGVTWSYHDENMARSVYLAIGYKWLDILSWD